MHATMQRRTTHGHTRHGGHVMNALHMTRVLSLLLLLLLSLLNAHVRGSAAQVTRMHVRAIYNVKLLDKGDGSGNHMISTSYTLCTGNSSNVATAPESATTDQHPYTQPDESEGDVFTASLASRIQRVRDAHRDASSTLMNDNHYSSNSRAAPTAQQEAEAVNGIDVTHDMRLFLCQSGQGVEVIQHIDWMAELPPGLIPRTEWGREAHDDTLVHASDGTTDHDDAHSGESGHRGTVTLEGVVARCAQWGCDMEYIMPVTDMMQASLQSGKGEKARKAHGSAAYVAPLNHQMINNNSHDACSANNGMRSSKFNDHIDTEMLCTSDHRAHNDTSCRQEHDLHHMTAPHSADTCDTRSESTHASSSSQKDTSSPSDVIRLPPAYGGWGVAALCCGSLNSTMYLVHTHTSEPMVILQTDILLYDNVGPKNNPLHDIHVPFSNTTTPGSESKSLSTSGEMGLTYSRFMRGCAVALRDVAHAASSASAASPPLGPSDAKMQHVLRGVAGISVTVMPQLCGYSVADVVSSSSINWLQRGYIATVVVSEFADEVALPEELIVSVLHWTRFASFRDSSSDSVNNNTNDNNYNNHDDNSSSGDMPPQEAVSLFDSGMCRVEFNRSVRSAYRNGRQFVCPVTDEMMHGLPELQLRLSEKLLYNTSVIVSPTMETGSYSAHSRHTKGQLRWSVGDQEVEDDIPACRALRINLQRQVRPVSPARARRLYASANSQNSTSSLPRYELVLASTGSYTAEYDKPNINERKEPVIAVGLAALSGLDMFAVTRHLVRRSDVEQNTSADDSRLYSLLKQQQDHDMNNDYPGAGDGKGGGEEETGSKHERMATAMSTSTDDASSRRRWSPWLGQPVMFFAPASNERHRIQPGADDAHTKQRVRAGDMCMAAKRCLGNDVYIQSINKCAQTQCKGYLLYVYNTTTLQCDLNIPILVVGLCVMGVMLVTELMLFCVKRRSTIVTTRYVRDLASVMQKKQ